MGQQMNPANVREMDHQDDRRSPRLDPESLGHLASELSGSRALDLVVGLVHDIRTPLSSILLLAESLVQGRSGDLNDVQRRQLSLVYGAVLGLSTLAGDVGEMAEDGGKVVRTKASSFSIGELLESVADTVRPIAVEKELELRVVAPPDNDERMGHRPALNRVLLNLATNALKFTDEGYVEIAATSNGGRRLPFSVRDTGPGFTPTALESYLGPFRESHTESHTGNGYRLSRTGLGLTTCEKLLQSMGSKLKVETRHGWGTRFHFELDLPSASAFRS